MNQLQLHKTWNTDSDLSQDQYTIHPVCVVSMILDDNEKICDSLCSRSTSYVVLNFKKSLSCLYICNFKIEHNHWRMFSTSQIYLSIVSHNCVEKSPAVTQISETRYPLVVVLRVWWYWNGDHIVLLVFFGSLHY